MGLSPRAGSSPALRTRKVKGRLLWAPWRIEYIERAKKGEKEECFLCKAWREGDELVVWKGKKAFVIMNKYPYNSGHVMVCPADHVSEFAQISPEAQLEIFKLIQKTIDAMRKTIFPHGFNIGVNLGRVAGAGLEEHIHFHIVPRWNGDTNFMVTCSDSKVIVEDIRRSMLKIRDALAEEMKK